MHFPYKMTSKGATKWGVEHSFSGGTDRLREANKISAETEAESTGGRFWRVDPTAGVVTRQEVGVQALQDLRRQREAMIRMKDNTHDVGLEPEKYR